jgi:hypothetical protein
MHQKSKKMKPYREFSYDAFDSLDQISGYEVVVNTSAHDWSTGTFLFNDIITIETSEVFVSIVINLEISKCFKIRHETTNINEYFIRNKYVKSLNSYFKKENTALLGANFHDKATHIANTTFEYKILD